MTIVLTVSLPWPASELNPNSRSVWNKNKAVTAARLVALVEMTKHIHKPIYPGRYRVVYDFYPPDGRNRDLDNMVSMCKPYVDGIFQACDGNDAWIVESRAAKHEKVRNGKVKISIEDMEP